MLLCCIHLFVDITLYNFTQSVKSYKCIFLFGDLCLHLFFNIHDEITSHNYTFTFTPCAYQKHVPHVHITQRTLISCEPKKLQQQYI